jgi:hypothetical protein
MANQDTASPQIKTTLLTPRGFSNSFTDTPNLIPHSQLEEEPPTADPVHPTSIFEQISLTSFSAYLSHLSNNIGSRYYGTDGNDKAAEYIAQQFEEMGLDVSFHEFSSSGDNVVGKLPGGSIHNNQCIVVGAHYDTYPISSKGADDNGSGVAAVLEIARVLSQYRFNYTIYFVAFDEEEIGLYGSDAFAAYLHDNHIPVAFMYNFDMVIWDNPSAPADIKYEVIFDGGASQLIAEHIESIGLSYNLPVQTRHAPLWGMSDHAPFWDFDIPAVWFFEYGGLGNPYIHSSQDHLAQPDYSMALGTQVTKNAATALADMATIVSTIPGFPEAAFVPPTPIGYIPPQVNTPIVLEITDSMQDVNHVELSINGGPWINISSGLNSTHCTYYWNGLGQYGETQLYAQVYDAAGWKATITHTFKVDKGLDCTITTPSPGEQIQAGTICTIWVNATDLDGSNPTLVQIRINEGEWHLATTHIFNQRYLYNWEVTGSGIQTIHARATDTNGNTNSSQVEIEVMVYLPTIHEVFFWPTNPFQTSSVLVSAHITPHPMGADIYNVQVIYSFDDSTWKNRRLLYTHDDIYQYTMGPFPAGTHVQFYIVVEDTVGNIVPYPGANEYYTFTVMQDPLPFAIVGGVAVIAAVITIGVFVLWHRRTRIQ